MPCCAIVTCRARSNTSNRSKGGLSFHRFPKAPEMREKWIQATGRTEWIPTKHSTICSQHFTVDDFDEKKSGNKYLIPEAVPTLDVIQIINPTKSNKPELYKPQTSDVVHGLIDTAMKRINGQEETDELMPSTSSALTPSTDNTSVDHDIPSSNASTRREKKLESIIKFQKNTIARQKMYIKRIQAQNRRLKREVYKMEVVIKDLDLKYSKE